MSFRVTRVPLADVSIDVLHAIHREAEAIAVPSEYWLSPAQYTDYGNLLTSFRGGMARGVLAFNGVPVIEKPRWPDGTLGIVHKDKV